VDAEGITVAEAIAAHAPKFPAPPPRRLLGYVEAHIEQGPVLESLDLPLGLVTAISGQTRARVALTGRAGHAGTTPMALRRDALAGAAECVLLTEEMAKREPSLVATVGQLELAAPASNVIPGEAWFTLDIRDPDAAAREHFRRQLFSEIERRMEARGLAARIETALDAPAVACDPGLGDALARIVEEAQGQCPRLVSGAGHDAVALAEVTRAAMLFVRCREGLSHHPDEFATAADIALATDVLAGFLGNFPA
jgi:hydantoinase/carbamoylase family amidase